MFEATAARVATGGNRERDCQCGGGKMHFKCVQFNAGAARDSWRPVHASGQLSLMNTLQGICSARSSQCRARLTERLASVLQRQKRFPPEVSRTALLIGCQNNSLVGEQCCGATHHGTKSPASSCRHQLAAVEEKQSAQNIESRSSIVASPIRVLLLVLQRPFGSGTRAGSHKWPPADR